MASLNLGVAELGESLTEDKGYTAVMGGQGKEPGQLPDCRGYRCGVQSGTASPGHCALSVHSTSAKPRQGGRGAPSALSLSAGPEPHRNVSSTSLGGNRHQDEMSPLGRTSMKVGLRAQPDPVELSHGPGVCDSLTMRQCRKPPCCRVWFQRSAGQEAEQLSWSGSHSLQCYRSPTGEGEEENKSMNEAGCLLFHLCVCLIEKIG